MTVIFMRPIFMDNVPTTNPIKTQQQVAKPAQSSYIKPIGWAMLILGCALLLRSDSHSAQK
jgi:hypothetical protein